MPGRAKRIRMGALAVLVVFAATAGIVIGAQDERSEGEIVRVVASDDGGTEIWREQGEGRVVIEHQEPDRTVWYESNDVVGPDGGPVICPDGTPLRIDFDREVPDPSEEELAEARAELRNDPTHAASLNEYTGKIELVDAVQVEDRNGMTISIPVAEPKVYRCGPNNEPVTVPLSEIDPQAAREARSDAIAAIKEQAASGELDELTGLGEDPPGLAPAGK